MFGLDRVLVARFERQQQSEVGCAVKRLFSLYVAALFVVAPAGAVRAEPADVQAADKTVFLRVTRDDNGRPRALQTAVVQYTAAAGDSSEPAVSVDLIAAVHVGERSYFSALNKLFTEYDAVLYELVAPDDAAVPADERGANHPVAMMQTGLKDLLGLEFQLEHIDYKQDNFVHADMTPEELAQSMSRRGEDPVGMFFRMMGRAIAQQARNPQSGASDTGLFFAMLQEDRSHAMRLMMAEQFNDLDAALHILEGPNGSAILTDRNQAAIDVLKEQLATPKRRIAIFYGAGHMPDLGHRLVNELKFTRGEQRWIDAWDLRPADEREADEGDESVE